MHGARERRIWHVMTAAPSFLLPSRGQRIFSVPRRDAGTRAVDSKVGLVKITTRLRSRLRHACTGDHQGADLDDAPAVGAVECGVPSCSVAASGPGTNQRDHQFWPGLRTLGSHGAGFCGAHLVGCPFVLGLAPRLGRDFSPLVLFPRRNLTTRYFGLILSLCRIPCKSSPMSLSIRPLRLPPTTCAARPLGTLRRSHRILLGRN